VPTFLTLIRNTSPAATAGLPSVTLPLPVTGSAPVGVQLIGARMADRDLLAVAVRVDALLRPEEVGQTATALARSAAMWTARPPRTVPMA
jgi:mandelamide amidase